jgi:formylglycine-generating enzyme required for sulfatase activity
MSEQGGGILREIEPGRFRVEHPLAVNEKDGSLLVYVPAGEFEMGDGQDNNCPPHRVTLSAYWIGVYGVTNAQYRKFVDATGHRAPDKAEYGTAVWQGQQFPAEKADHPVVCVDWDDAVAYARWAGCELPTEAQWEKAARGPAGLIYPWGKDWDATKCRHDGNKGNETTARVDAYPGGVSGYGTYNQSGNVWEWCADWYGEDYYRQSPVRDPRGPDGGSLRVYRGGCWRYDDPWLYRAALRNWDVPARRYDSRGLRLVRAAS